jgi:hypothetical protein
LIDDFFSVYPDFNNGRALEIYVALMQVAPSKEILDRIVAHLFGTIADKAASDSVSFEARLLEAIIKCEGRVHGGKCGVSDVTKAFNEGLAEKEKRGSRSIGHSIKGLGFRPTRLTGGPSGFWYDVVFINRLKTRYLSALPELSLESSLSSLSSLTNNNSLEKSYFGETTVFGGYLGSEDEVKTDVEKSLSSLSLLDQTMISVGSAQAASAKPSRGITGLFKRIFPGEKCDNCGEYAVEFWVKPPVTSVIRRCPFCFAKLQKEFSNIIWVPLEGS